MSRKSLDTLGVSRKSLDTLGVSRPSRDTPGVSRLFLDTPGVFRPPETPFEVYSVVFPVNSSSELGFE